MVSKNIVYGAERSKAVKNIQMDSFLLVFSLAFFSLSLIVLSVFLTRVLMNIDFYMTFVLHVM